MCPGASGTARCGTRGHSGSPTNFVLVTLAIGFTGPLARTGLRMDRDRGAARRRHRGTFFMAFHANQGPGLGMPQMIQSRAQFGTRGVLVALIPALCGLHRLERLQHGRWPRRGFKAVGAGGADWAWYVGIIAVQAPSPSSATT